MAKVLAPFQIVGTIDDLTFYNTTDGNIVRQKGKSGITKKQFQENPIYDTFKKHNIEFGSCALKSGIFRALVKQFYDQAKEGSFAGRVNKLLFEILEEDTQNEHGKRKLENGLKTKDGKELLLNFEANKTRPLDKTWKTKIKFNWENLNLNSKTVNPEKDINWPEVDANQVHFQLAIVNWNYEKETFETNYSNQITFEKNNIKQTLNWTIETPKEKNLWIAYLCVSFSFKERKKTKLVHKKFNTATILDYKE